MFIFIYIYVLEHYKSKRTLNYATKCLNDLFEIPGEKPLFQTLRVDLSFTLMIMSSTFIGQNLRSSNLKKSHPLCLKEFYITSLFHLRMK